MNSKRLFRKSLCLSVLVVLTIFGCSQMSTQNQGIINVNPEGSNITIKGQIDYNNALGGYFVKGEEPGGEYFIMNENPKSLEPLFKSGKTLIIEGRIVRGAEYLFIEKIDGHPYQGEEKPAPK